MSNDKLKALPDGLTSVEPVKRTGLTIREIRHRRAMVMLQKEFCKEKIRFNALKLKNSSPFSRDYDGKGKALGRASGIAGKLIKGMNYLDYLMIGYSVFGYVRKFTSIFRKRK